MQRALRTINESTTAVAYDIGIEILDLRARGITLDVAAKQFDISMPYAYTLSTLARNFPQEVFVRLGVGKCEVIYKAKVPGNHLPAVYRIAGMCSMADLRRTLDILYGDPSARERVQVLRCPCKRSNPIGYDYLVSMRCRTCTNRLMSNRRTQRAYELRNKSKGLCECGKERAKGYTHCTRCIQYDRDRRTRMKEMAVVS